jgi:site-specific recombinase XerD
VFRPVDRHGNVLERRLSAQVVALVVKRAVRDAGLDPELFSGHSLRAGFVTTAKERGVDDAAVMEVTGHKTLAMVHTYHSRTKRWAKPASARLGL